MMYAFISVRCCHTELVEVLGVPALKSSAVGLSAASPRPEDGPAGFPLLSLTPKAGKKEQQHAAAQAISGIFSPPPAPKLVVNNA